MRTPARPSPTISSSRSRRGKACFRTGDCAWRSEEGDGPEANDTPVPVEAVVVSSLLGPFTDEIVPAQSAPANAPVVCTVEVLVSGPGEYDTPGCTLAAPGYYVWVERIDPARTPADQGGSRMRPWQSTFGVASEITKVTAPRRLPRHLRPAWQPPASTSPEWPARRVAVLVAGTTAIVLGAGGDV